MSHAKALSFVSGLLLLFTLSSFAQGPCPTATSTLSSAIPTRSGEMICLVPQVYGAGGLVGTDHGGPLFSTARFSHAAHFSNSALQSFTPLNAEIGSQLSQLAIPSPASGFIFSYNPSLGVVARQTESFGPILTERAETIGRHKLYVGFSYQFFDFDRADGVNLKNFGAVFQHEKEPSACFPGSPITCEPDGEPLFQKDIISTQNRIDLKVHQFTAVATFGVTNRLDISVAIPVLDVHMGMKSNAGITSFETAASFPPCCVHQFDPANRDIPQFETFVSSSQADFFNNKSASGIGDVVFRGKLQLLKHERAGLTAGMDVRVPTGDEKNFLGSGAWGLRPFVTFSYASRISPHATFGYQINGKSILAGDVTTNTRAFLPDVITYSVGADVGVTHRLTVSGDFLGQTLPDANTISSTTFTDFGGNTHPNITAGTSTINQQSIAVGGKVNPVGKLLLTGNVLFRLNDAGLHSKPVPLAGISYTF
jgi:hypothetical protein